MPLGGGKARGKLAGKRSAANTFSESNEIGIAAFKHCVENAQVYYNFFCTVSAVHRTPAVCGAF